MMQPTMTLSGFTMPAPRTPRNQPSPPTVDVNVTTPKRRWIDFTMPLPWLAGMVILGASGLYKLGGMIENQSTLLNQIVNSQAKIEARQSETNVRVDTLRDQYMELKQSQSIATLRINNLEKYGDKK